MESNGIQVLYIPYELIVDCFKIKDIDLDYAEDAPDSDKTNLILKFNSLSCHDITDIESCIKSNSGDVYANFMDKLKDALFRKPDSIIIVPLFGKGKEFNIISDAIDYVDTFSEEQNVDNPFCKFEVYIRFGNGDKIDCSLENKERLILFLEKFNNI